MTSQIFQLMCCIAKCFAQGYDKFKKLGSMLKGLADTQDIHIKSSHDDFARVSANKKCCRVVLSIEGYFATVLLVDETIDQLEQKLDSMHHLANSLGLLDEAKPQHWASTFEAIATPHWCRMVIWLLRCAAQLLSANNWYCLHYFNYTENFQLLVPFNYVRYVSSSNDISESTSSVWFGLSLSLCWASYLPMTPSLGASFPALAFCPGIAVRGGKDEGSNQHKFCIASTLVCRGVCTISRLPVLQLLTVLLQAKGKFSMLNVLVDGVETDLWALHSFKCFLGLLSFNIIYPALILAFPHSAVSRVGAACMDAALDLSYVLLWLFLLAQTQEATGFDFDRNPFLLLSKLASHDFWSYMSVYFSVAHVCCVCRSLEQINWPQLLQFRPRKRSVGQRFTRMMFAVAYALGLFLTLWELLKQVHPDPCSPCRCSSIESNGLKDVSFGELLFSCNMGNFQNWSWGVALGCTISNISPDALRGLTKLRKLHLSNNGLKELPEGGAGLMQQKFWSSHIFCLSWPRCCFSC